MSKHHNSKIEAIPNRAAITTVRGGMHEQDQTPFAEDNGRDVETARLAYS